MKFHQEELNYGKVYNPDTEVVELDTPRIGMNSILKSFTSSETVSEVKVELAELEFEDRMKQIAELYEDIDDGEARDYKILKIFENFSTALQSVEELDDYDVGLALDELKDDIAYREALDEALKDVIELDTPLVQLNTIAAEATREFEDDAVRRSLIDRRLSEAQRIVTENQYDVQTVEMLIESFDESMDEIYTLTDEQVEASWRDEQRVMNAEEDEIDEVRSSLAEVIQLKRTTFR